MTEQMPLMTAEKRAQQIQERIQNKRYIESRIKDLRDAREIAARDLQLTKEMAFQGIDYVVSVPVPELGGYLRVRALNNKEFNDIRRKILGGLTLKQMDDIRSVEDLMDREINGKYFAASLALSIDGQKWSMTEVSKLPPGIPDRIYRYVQRVSGFPSLI